MNVILLAPEEVDADGTVRLVAPHDVRAQHILSVLTATTGQQLRVGTVNGPLGTATVTSIGPEGIVMRCQFDAAPPPVPRVDLLLALPRPKVLQRLWSQLAALGVGRIMLANAARVERHYFDTHVLEPATFEPLLLEGLQQARDTHVPKVSVHRRFKVLVEDELDTLFPVGSRLVADPGQPTGIDDALATCQASDRVLLAVGPEGGWVDFERRLLAHHGFRSFGLGPRTLRTDTATIALLSLAHHALDRATRTAPRLPR